MADISTPEIAELVWGPDMTAEPTEGYWELHRTGKQHLAKAGLRVEKTTAGWRVRFRPDTTTPDDLKSGVMAAREVRMSTAINMSDVERENREREAERRATWEAGKPEREAERKRQLENIEARRRERVLDAQRFGRETLEKWGEFTDRKVKLRELVDARDLDQFSLITLLKIVKATDNKANLRRAVASRLPKTELVNWDDDVVVKAIEVLTHADSDHATVANRAGWSSSDSSPGHWCAAMLRSGDADNRVLAIRAGRGLVGKYVTQLTAAGLKI